MKKILLSMFIVLSFSNPAPAYPEDAGVNMYSSNLLTGDFIRDEAYQEISELLKLREMVLPEGEIDRRKIKNPYNAFLAAMIDARIEYIVKNQRGW